MGVWQIYRYTEKPQEKETSQNKFGGSFNSRDNVKAPTQFRREGQPQHLKR